MTGHKRRRSEERSHDANDSENGQEFGEEQSTSGSSSESEETSQDEGDSSKSSTVEAAFEFFDPKEADFHALKDLMKNFLDGQDFALSELVDAIIKQSSVGTVLKAEEEAAVFGVISVLNLNRTRDLACLQEIRKFVLQGCKESDVKSAFQEAWSPGHASGLIISERVINCPPQLAAPLQQALFDEIDWATEDEPTKELRESFKLEQFILLTRAFTDPVEDKAQGSKRGKNSSEKETTSLIVYGRPEDEYYHRHSSHAFTITTGQSVSKNDLQPLRLVLLLTREQINQARQDLRAIFGDTES